MFVGMVLNQHFMPQQIKITNYNKGADGSRRGPGVSQERGEKTGAEERKACPQAVNGRKPSVWGSRDDGMITRGKYASGVFV